MWAARILSMKHAGSVLQYWLTVSHIRGELTGRWCSCTAVTDEVLGILLDSELWCDNVIMQSVLGLAGRTSPDSGRPGRPAAPRGFAWQSMTRARDRRGLVTDQRLEKLLRVPTRVVASVVGWCRLGKVSASTCDESPDSRHSPVSHCT